MATLRKYYHNEGACFYEELGGGLVRVTRRTDGISGVFRTDGPWVEGELHDASLHMLIWTGGPNVPSEFNYRSNPIVPADINRPSGWPENLERLLRLHRPPCPDKPRIRAPNATPPF